MADLNLSQVTGGLKIVSDVSSIVINEYSTKRNNLNKDEITIISDLDEDYSEYTIDFSAWDNVFLNGILISDAATLETSIEVLTQGLVNIYTNGREVSIQNPFPTNSDSVYNKDIDLDNSDFTNWVGDVNLLFQSPYSASITNSTTDNPKQIILAFNRTMNALQIGFGENNGGNFSNLKISLLGSGGSTRGIFDESTNNTKRTSRNAQFTNELFNSLLIEFYTSDAVSLSNITIQKASYNATQIQGQVKGNVFKNVGVDGFGKMKVALATDIFNRLPVALPETISDNSLVSEYSNDLFWSHWTSGTGASIIYDKATSSNLLSVTTTGDFAASQLKLRAHYQPAKAQEFLDTGLLTPELDVNKYFGYFDLDNYNSPTINGTIYNGIVFKTISTTSIKWEIWNNGVLEDEASQDNWNLDKLDGTGASGIVLDLNFPEIGVGELEWLGVGAVRVGFNIGGVNIPVHIFEHANIKGSGVYMRTAKLPICYMIESTGGSGSMRQICNSIISGGGQNTKGVQRSVFNTTDVSILNGATELLIGIRLKPSDFDSTVIQESISVVSRAKNDFTLYLCINPTYTGTVSWVDKPNSSIQYAVNNNNPVTDLGIDILAQKVSGTINAISLPLNSALRIGKGLNNDYDELWIVILADDGNEDFSGAINYRELL
jgi:hypothetical protein